jgi:HEAT repeat protein
LQVREAAAESLGDIGDPAAVGPLVSVLNDADPKVAAMAATSLGRLKAADAAPALLALLSRGAPESAAAAARALGDVGARQAAGTLSEALLNDKLESAVREEAAAALGKLKDPAALPALVSSLNNPDDRIRWAAADGLGRLGLPESVAPLGKTLASDKDSRVREVAALALGNTRAKHAVDFLLRGMNDAEPRVSEQSLTALLAILGTDADEYGRLAGDLMQRGENAKAARICRAAIDKIAKEEPEEDVLVVTEKWGVALADSGRWAEARKPLEQALEDDRNNTIVLLKLTECYVQLGEHETAAVFGAAALRRFPKEAEALSTALLPALEALFHEGKIDLTLRVLNALAPEAFAAFPQDLRDQLASLKERCERVDKIVEVEIAALSAPPAGDGEARLRAMARLIAVGERGIPYLVEDGLGSGDERVQSASMGVLAKLTGHPFDVPKDATAEQRQGAIKAWLSWWQTKPSKDAGPGSATSPSGPGPTKRH